jgi:cytochrome c oxidase cbb3-type subunit 3
MYGVPAKGMVSWRGTLKPDEILDVAGYLLTLRGTNPANAKSPEGELIAD